ncbi:hypothetical protein FJY90_07245, partial [Candidatus Gottesmanbacteria bacterium]|nr:hypothetical protein [Candidatus Gottesmanbacteria bacterium]
MKKRVKEIKRRSILLSLILLTALLFRVYKLQDWLIFGMDQEYQALIVKNIITGKHFPLIGVNAGDTGIYLGPFFSYFAVIPQMIFSGDPIGGALSALLISMIVCFLIYKIGKNMFSEKVGVLASLFYSSSFLIAFYDRQFWNPMPIPLFSLLIGYILYQILEKRTEKLIWLSVTYAIAIQCHLSILIFSPLIVYVIFIRRKEFSKKIALLSMAIFILLQTPLVIFELRHNFLNSKAAVNIILSKNQSAEISSLQERNSLFLSTLGRFFWIPSYPDLFLESGQCRELTWLRKDAYPESILFILAGISIFIFLSVKKNIFNNSSKIMLGIFISTIVFVEFYQRQIFEYYLLFFFPWLGMILGCSCNYIWQKEHGKIIITPIITIFVILNLITVLTANFSYSYKEKYAAIIFTRNYVSSNKYLLEAVGECSRYGGYRYLFEYLIGTPVYSYMDSYFEWLYRDKKLQLKPEKIVLLSMIDSRDKQSIIAKWEESKVKLLLENNILTEGRFGKIKVLILEPKNNDK